MSDDHGLPALGAATVHLASSVGTLTDAVARSVGQPAATSKIAAELRQARAIGQFTVLTAVAKVQRSFAKPAEPAPAATAEPTAATTTIPDVPRAIPDYPNLAANQIVPLLAGLTDVERAAVRDYERATRARRTILGALGE